MIRLGWPATVLALALSVSACGGGGDSEFADGGEGGTETPARGDLGEIVSYKAEDGAEIVAELAVSSVVQRPPVVVLFHELNRSRLDWLPLVQPLLEAGYAVLAPDLRTFGESTGCEGGPCTLENVDDLVKDITAAIAFIQSRPEVDGGRIAIAGAGIGANLAYYAVGAFPEADTAVALSVDSGPRRGELLGRNNPNLDIDFVMFMSDQRDALHGNDLSRYVEGVFRVNIYPETVAHGVELLADPQVITDIIAWLKETL